jgi:hypothetical protein
MKRLFVLFAVLAFTACTNEELISSDPLDDEVGTPTYATFTFNASDAATKSSMITDENETDALNDVRVLIFRAASGDIEIDRTIPPGTSTITIQIMSGQKMILVMANGDSGMLPTKGSSFNYSGFRDVIYNISSTDPVSDPTTSIDNLSNLVKPTGSVMTNSVRSSVISLNAGVSATESMNPSGSNNNYVSVDLQRTVAKVTVFQDAEASLTTTDGRGTLSDLKYCITTVNRSLYLFQNFSNDVLVTPEYIPTLSHEIDPNLHYHYYNFYDYRELLTDLSASKAVYITENNPSVKRSRNTTCIGIEAVFKPKKGHFAKDISYDMESETFTVIPSETDLETASDIYLFNNNSYGPSINTLLAGADAIKLARMVTYHVSNRFVSFKASLDDPAYAAITDSQIAMYFDKYTDGKCYYRLNIGSQTNGALVDKTVIRNHHYRAKITKYDRIGASQMMMLIEQPENEILAGVTNITASFNVVDWAVDDINY